MYLSNRDIKWAIECGKLIVDPRPEELNTGYDETSIDLHLDSITAGARIWDMDSYSRDVSSRGSYRHAEIQLGSFDWEAVSAGYLIELPSELPEQSASQKVFRRGNEAVVRPGGFLLWTTRERVGTPKVNPGDTKTKRDPELICFVNGKSTRARTGLIVHFTAPTIHAGWVGKVTLEITNLGPFEFVLREMDVIAQLTVATISSAPDITLRKSKQQTQGQMDPSGTFRKSRGRKK